MEKPALENPREMKKHDSEEPSSVESSPIRCSLSPIPVSDEDDDFETRANKRKTVPDEEEKPAPKDEPIPKRRCSYGPCSPVFDTAEDPIEEDTEGEETGDDLVLQSI